MFYISGLMLKWVNENFAPMRRALLPLSGVERAPFACQCRRPRRHELYEYSKNKACFGEAPKPTREARVLPD